MPKILRRLPTYWNSTSARATSPSTRRTTAPTWASTKSRSSAPATRLRGTASSGRAWRMTTRRTAASSATRTTWMIPTAASPRSLELKDRRDGLKQVTQGGDHEPDDDDHPGHGDDVAVHLFARLFEHAVEHGHQQADAGDLQDDLDLQGATPVPADPVVPEPRGAGGTRARAGRR